MTMRGAWFIARKDIAHTLRQREAIAWVFVMPIVFMYFIGTVTGSFGSPAGSGERRDPLVLQEPRDGGFLVDEIARRLEGQNYAVARVTSAEEQRVAERRLVLASPEGMSFTEAILAGRQQRVTVRSRSEGPGAQFDQVRVARAVYSVIADLAVCRDQGTVPSSAAFAAIAAMPRALSLQVSSAGRRTEAPRGFAQAVPGVMVMFTMLVLLTSGAIMLVIERRQGLLRRVASTPIPRHSVAAGKWVGKLAIGLVQVGFALIISTAFFGMRWGGALPAAAGLLVLWAAFNASLAMLLGTLARSEPQTAGIGVLSTLVLAALGGCWWPIEITPPWMQKLALALPTGWTMDGLHRLVSFGDPWGAVVPHATALAVATLVIGWLAARFFRYQ
jgi:ABC-type Na+ efflux pump permease subunit